MKFAWLAGVAATLELAACGFDSTPGPGSTADGTSGGGSTQASSAVSGSASSTSASSTSGTSGVTTSGSAGSGTTGTTASVATGAGGAASGAGGGSGTGTVGAGGSTAGSGPDGSAGGSVDAGPRDASMRDVYVADRPPGSPVLIHVVNACPFELWLRATGKEAVLMPDNAHLATGAAQDYIAPDPWTAARITAYLGQPPANEIDKVEVTIVNRIINHNITYVDWVGLPVEMIGIGTGSDCKRIGCFVPESQILSGCPAGLLSGKKCLSAGSYCANAANQAQPFCHALDAKIAQCAQDPQYAGCAGAAGATTPQTYACSGFFGGSPKWCAALNRGMIDNAESKDATLYYKTTPFNAYAAWVHSVCPIYAFPYDDFGNPNESSFKACSGGTQLNVTFCPEG